MKQGKIYRKKEKRKEIKFEKNQNRRILKERPADGDLRTKVVKQKPNEEFSAIWLIQQNNPNAWF